MSILLAKLLLLVFVANGAPILVRWLMAGRFAFPVDAGCKFIDGKRLLGKAKTWRGILASVIATMLLALFLELGWYTGLLIACG
ncbi:MAG: CDP-archaeol synthase, partial [Gammaproteobacteria bacterium]|nr:CDP-archaeol synthase [Gammaproteobacteria bacterium]